MWTLKRRSNFTVVVYLAVHILAATLVFGCENRKSFYDNNRNDINLVPIQMENPEDPIADEEIDAVSDEEAIVVDLDNPTPRRKSRVGEEPQPPAPVAQKPVVVKPTPAKPTTPKAETTPSAPTTNATEASRFIKAAFWVVQNEARKIGTPCNFYVSRVLDLTGYSKDGFLANDFDIYARKHFSSYKNELFNTSNLESERARLKRHIWSYPARTPFIIQWERSAPQPGHIAIVERIGDQLVVYQASLNRHIARREQTSIDRLLNHARKARMTVYSEFVAR
ncbi:MAG: hypothetical protein V4654_00305 [Bdellovibrionota bacterium]